MPRKACLHRTQRPDTQARLHAIYARRLLKEQYLVDLAVKKGY
jgi:hypothetical protein